MRSSKTQIYMHLVWATWDRMPLLTEPIRPQVYACLQAECARMRVQVLAIGGVDDHVHLLVRMPGSVAVAPLVKQIKGASSHMVNHEIPKSFGFRWQGSYGAFSVSKINLPLVRDYILRQEEHHRLGTFHRAAEP